MKKKIVVIAVGIAALVSVSILGTIAYLTDRESVTNTFTVGQVNIDLDEAKVDEDGKAVEDERVTDGNDYHIIPGKTYDKDPTVTVKADSEESYIRMLVTINNLKELDEIFAPDGANLLTIFNGYDADTWIYETETENEEDNTITYEFRYKETVSTMEKEDLKLEALFDSITIPGNITGEQLQTISDLEIEVEAHAIQKETFENADSAWAAFDKQVNGDK